MPTHVSLLLNAIHRGETTSSDELLPLLYSELRRLAREKLAQEPAGQSIQATALVHEAYIRLVDSPTRQLWDSRNHFFAAAAEAMRRILIERARRDGAQKRGGEMHRVGISLSEVSNDCSGANVLVIDEAITRLAAMDPQAAKLVKLRYFTGLQMTEIAELLEISERTARRLWVYARSFLLEELSDNS